MVDVYTLNADQSCCTPARKALVKGKFVYNTIPGGTMSVTYGYKEEQTERYDFIDQQIYEVPLALAKQLNRPYNNTRLWSFESVEFIDLDRFI